MGQLEKYGLYVLCLVIFLILGVAIWGGDPAPHSQAQKEAIKLAAEQDQGKAAEKAPEPTKQADPKLEASKPTGDAMKGPEAAKLGDGTDQAKTDAARQTPFGEFIAGDKGKLASNKPVTAPSQDAAAKGTPVKSTPDKVEPRVHVVQHGDTLHDIAVAEYGSAARVNEILALNPGLDPNRMRDGIKIKLPAAKAAESKTAADAVAKKDAAAKPTDTAKAKPVAGAAYKVKSGDTLTSISRAAYGTDRHVKEILAANRGRLASADRLRENMVLSLPAASPSGR